MASSCAYLGTTFRPHQRNIEKLLCWTQSIKF
jgi:hypothetical protein